MEKVAIAVSAVGRRALVGRDLSVSFDGNRVLDAASLVVEGGSVHALLGQNGSGKSTLLKVLSGVYAPETGASLSLGGQDVGLPTGPDAVRRQGLAIVHQDLGLAGNLSVLENIRLRLFTTGLLERISWRNERRLVEEAMARYGVELPIDKRVDELPSAARTVVAVVRALEEMGSSEQRNVLILDEPTPHLTPEEVTWLFGIVRTVASEGTGVILVTHRLEEVFEVADMVTVLRDGRVELTAPVAGLDHPSLTRAVLGYELASFERAVDKVRADEPVVTLTAETTGQSSFTLRAAAGEIVGITGLIGAGWERIPYLLFGAQPDAAGSIEIGGDSLDLSRWTPRKAMAAGVALIPRDRSSRGALVEFSLQENLTLLQLGRYFRAGFLRSGAERRRTLELIEAFDIRPGDPDMAFKLLSGGNQQKALLAKWWERRPTLVLLDEPTQGIDVGARAHIYQLIASAAEAGAAIVISSVEYDELAKICSRVVVFVDGAPRVELVGDEVNQSAIAQACYERNPADASDG